MKRSLTVLAALGLATASAPALAQNVWTGSSSGAYYNYAGKPVVDALTKVKFRGYQVRESKGTLDNIEHVIASIKSGGQDFGIAQADVFAIEAKKDPEKFKQLTVVRPIFCEGLWIVTKDKDLDYGKVIAYGRRLSAVIAGGGSVATFENLQAIDSKDEKGRYQGLGRISNKKVVPDGQTMLNEVLAGTADVGFMVQFFTPENSNTKFISENKLNVIPVLSPEARAFKVGDNEPYTAGQFTLSSGFWSGKTLVNTCTKAILFGVNPDAISNADQSLNQQDRLTELKKLHDVDFLPKDSAIAGLMKTMWSASGKALDEAFAAAKAAKERAEEAMK